MRRGRRGIVTAVAVALVGAILGLWVRSHGVLDEVSFADADGRTFAAVSFRGGLHLSRAGDRAARRPLTWDACAIPAGADWGAVYRRGQIDWQWLGFAKVSGSSMIVPAAATVVAGTPPLPAQSTPATGRTFTGTSKVELVPWLMAPPYTSFVVPYWALALVASATLAVAPVRRVRRAWRRRRGRCADCGYDLRASPVRCPECGAAAAPALTIGRT